MNIYTSLQQHHTGIIKRESSVLLSITAINALAAVYSFIADAPDSSLRISVNWLEHSPFKNFLIPGIVLFTIISVRSLKTAIFMLLHWRKAERSLIIQSVLICGWIIVQVMMLQQFNLLHPVVFGFGLLLFFAGLRLIPSRKN